MRYFVFFVLMTLSLSGIAQTREQVELEGEVEGVPSENNQEGDLNSNTQVNGDNVDNSYNTNKTYNGAGSSGMPVNTAISPSLMSNGTESCLQSVTGGLQLIGVGVSTGKYMQDTECNRRRDSITLSNMGMKVAAISLMCQNPSVWRAMFMSATPCPITKGGKLVVGRNALLEIKRNPELHITDYSDNKELYDNLLGVDTDDTPEVESATSVSSRFRTSVQ